MDEKKIIREFLREHSVGVLSTTSKEGAPEAAAVEFGSTNDFELIFDTYITYRKYKNLRANPHVAFVIWDPDRTLQYEGVAHELTGEEERAAKDIFFTQVPTAKKFDSVPDTRFFKIRPRWVRYRDYRVSQEPLFEINL